jgi:hypothetical protein
MLCRTRSSLACLVILLGSAAPALCATDADIDASFNPYATVMPVYPGLTPGLVLTKDNVDTFKEVVEPGLALFIRNGWYEPRVGITTSFDVDKRYIEATKHNASHVKLGNAPGELMGYAGGRPFPEEPVASDPRAGEKMAWNFRYQYGDGGAITPIQWKYRNLNTGDVERLLRVDVYVLKFKYRLSTPPLPEIAPNPSNLYAGTYLKVHSPAELRNTQLLIQRHDDDSLADDGYMYFGFQRRVRRLAPGQTTDAFLGSDVMIEDFDGYNARVSDMRWKFIATRTLLMPMFQHDELKLSDEFKDSDGFQYVNFGGKGGCFPDITWQLRKVHVVEAEPIAAGHPVSKRVFYFDAQTATIPLSLIYDRKGELWKVGVLGKSHPDHHHPQNKGAGLPLADAGAMVDVQARHCSTGQFKALALPQLSAPGMFQTQFLRGGD